MADALSAAREALAHGDVPVGAVVLGPAGDVLSRARNEREVRRDPTAHAEILALRAAAITLSATVDESATASAPALVPAPASPRGPGIDPPIGAIDTPGSLALGGWRLSGCTLVVTLEPCVMCTGAMVAARVDRCVFGAWDDKAGACGSVWDLARDPASLHRVEVIPGLAAEQSAELLRAFFLPGR